MKIIIFALTFLAISFDLNAKVIYLNPVRDAKYVSINNNIIIGFNERITSSNLSSHLIVTGTQSGHHTGEIILTADGKKLIFNPAVNFAFGEEVNVTLNDLKTEVSGNNNLIYSFQTQISKPDAGRDRLISSESGSSTETNYMFPGDYSTLPQINVVVSNNPSQGDLYLSNFLFSLNPYTPYLIIANNAGTITYSRLMNTRTLDFKKQPNKLLTYFTGNKFYGEDINHNLIDSFECGNGYTTDNHELRLHDGHAYLMSYDPEIVDMSQVVPGGNPNATVYGLVIQELDQDKNVVFQWRSWDYFAITDAIHENLTGAIVDYVHGNAIEIDNDGNLMISSRHLSEITKINHESGEVMWRLGGVQNQFTFINDPVGFSYQHSIRRISNGNVILYDNGNFHTPQYSRAVEYKLDEVNKTATLVWQYRHTPLDIYGNAMGSVQRLLNGNTLISWGSANPTITEVTPSGVRALELNLPFFMYTYRTFRDESAIALKGILAPEGFYDPENDRLNMSDTIVSYLRRIEPPYSIADSSKSVLNAASLEAVFRYYHAGTGNYYISVKHRNSIETWSRVGGEFLQEDGSYAYDFTESVLKAYGKNLVLKGSKYCIYSGDINQDGSVDVSDLGLADNAAFNFITGYVRQDVDGNNIVDALDLVIIENNAYNIVIRVTPP